MDCSPPDSSAHGNFQARILQWVAISFSRGSSQPKDQTRISCTAGQFFYDTATEEAHSKALLGGFYLHLLGDLRSHAGLLSTIHVLNWA